MGFLDDLRGKSGKSGVLADERLAPTDDGDHERFSHYVDKIKSQNLQLLENLSELCAGKNGYQIEILKNFQSAQHVKRFTPA